MKSTLKLFLALIISVSLFQVSCTKDEEEEEDKTPTFATVTTTEITNIYATTCTSGGVVTDDGNSEVTSRGICYSRTETTPDITINDGMTDNGSGTGSFTSIPSGLLNGSTYYLRAYATNGVGTSYGEVLTFNTIAK